MNIGLSPTIRLYTGLCTAEQIPCMLYMMMMFDKAKQYHIIQRHVYVQYGAFIMIADRNQNKPVPYTGLCAAIQPQHKLLLLLTKRLIRVSYLEMSKILQRIMHSLDK